MVFSFKFMFIIYICFLSSVVSQVQDFVSIDCGGTSNYTDPSTGLAWISDVGLMSRGKSIQVENPNGNQQQFQKRRDFPIDSKKYCYTLNTVERRRYLVRATFQYGSLKSEDTYPKFELYLDATQWATVTIFDASRTYVNEMIIRASSDSVDVCICCATTGFPFISTLELRPFNLSMYATDYEDKFFLKVAARVNFGASSKDAIRYPDDPYDRIWDSDLVKRQNYLVGVAPGTERISTSRDVDTRSKEYPPMKVMQTAVVGTKRVLSYRLNLDGFPGMARAYAYFAEIEDLGANESRKFRLEQPNLADYNRAVVNIAENANGDYTLYEPSYMNVSLEFVLSFSFRETPDSTRGPLLNAIEISKYVQIAAKTDRQDLAVLNALRFMSAENLSVDEGDPCVPTPWEWVNCSSTAPSRITIMYIQNNSFSGEIPAGLLTGKIKFKYEYNLGLRKGERKQKHFKLIIGISVGVVAIVSLLLLGTLLILRNRRRKSSLQRSNGKGDSLRASTKPSTHYSISRKDEGVACYITLPDLEEATNNFSKKIGKGSFGSVYYGKMKDGKEIAVKMMADSSTHMNKQFATEVALLSRIHHRNLVPLIGYCEEEHQCILVYEYMHNGTLRDHIHGSTTQKRLDWQMRLRIAEDAARGLEYLHTGCNPSIIHRDVKTSNILLDINMRAKVSDFGLSRQAEEDLTHISSVARGTVGYLDPEYYASQQLTEKSDVYSFGVVLLELISGRKVVSEEDFGSELNIVHWARSLIRKGDVESIMDPVLVGSVKIESIWRIAEVALQCVEQHGVSRPRMQEIIVAVQDAMKIEKGSESNRKISPSSSTSKAQSSRKTLLTSFLEIESPDLSKDCLVPSAR
ncbi:LRR receptor-like serine/threonine-protein kinase [Pyrus ussuriensis x Pyrus communis]|uniref:LRR receptor-like serine/threonine-protein kinase n=1 Tax=Pyrus ussuriensis x Pyrus communis TaxID=2448454 RepID=A0A5N5G3F9_9ROSA|nr:LRR receptor-like serine/threonine-protein kinase [Pyrus ussuriensis x Pyrus communis]